MFRFRGRTLRRGCIDKSDGKSLNPVSPSQRSEPPLRDRLRAVERSGNLSGYSAYRVCIVREIDGEDEGLLKATRLSCRPEGRFQGGDDIPRRYDLAARLVPVVSSGDVGQT